MLTPLRLIEINGMMQSPLICRKLSAENRKLCTDVEKEAIEKKRLSMENEELHWKIRQSLDHSYHGGNSSGLLSMSVIEGKPDIGDFLIEPLVMMLLTMSPDPLFCILHSVTIFVRQWEL